MHILFNRIPASCLYLLVFWVLAGCSPGDHTKQTGVSPSIFPDYKDVTIPPAIAPLRFRFTEPYKSHAVVFRAGREQVNVRGSGEVRISFRAWNRLLKSGSDTIEITANLKKDKEWSRYEPFHMFISEVPADRYLTYRRIDPGYSVYGAMGIYQRDLTSYRERPVIENSFSEGSCVNCHSYGGGDPDKMMFHVRGRNGGTVIRYGGETRFVDLNTPETLSGGVYPYWHPAGKYIAFSVNITRQLFHNRTDKVLDVYDLASDLVVYDVINNRILFSPAVQDSTMFETFPAFSADGTALYFSAAHAPEEGGSPAVVRYDLYEIAFDTASGRTANEPYLLFKEEDKSITFPRPSPDGKYLMFTAAPYGTFPIWHKEADLYIMDLQTKEVRSVREINSPDTDSYHSWSSNSRWVVFSSRRIDGLHTRLYLTHLNDDGTFTKPFLLPQHSVRYSDMLLQSFNIPEFSKGPVAVKFPKPDHKPLPVVNDYN